MSKLKIKTKGMHCRSCEVLIKDELRVLDGVKNVEASHKSGIISVEFDDCKVSETDIINCIKQEGYSIE